MVDTNTILQRIEGKSVRSKAVELEKIDVDEDCYFEVVEAGLSRSPEEGAGTLQGLLRAKHTGRVSEKVLRDACACDEPERRRNVVRSFRARGCEEEFLTGVARLTVADGGRILSDFFEEGGSLRTVADWLSRLCDGYRREKRAGNIDPAYDGWFSDTWDSITDAVGTIAEAVSSVVDKILEAGKSFGELVGEVVEFPQRRINSLLETLLDGGKAVADIVAGIAEEAYSTVSSIVRGLVSAGEALADILEEAWDTGIVGYVVRALDAARNSIRNIVEAAIEVGEELVPAVAQALVDLATNAKHRADYIISVVRDVLEEVPQSLLDQLGDLVDAIYETARDAVDAGTSAILDVLDDVSGDLDALRSAIQGFLAGGLAVSTLLSRLYQRWSGESFFDDAILIVEELVSSATDFYEAVFDVSETITEAVLSALVGVGHSIADALEWAHENSASAIGVVLDSLSTLGELSASALYTLGQSVVDIGDGMMSLLESAIEWGTDAAKAVFDGILAAGESVEALLERITDDFTEFVEDAIEIVLDVGVRIKDVLAAGLELGNTVLAEFVEHLLGLGRSVWYILSWVVDAADTLLDVLESVFDVLLTTTMELSELVAWCVRRSFDVMKTGFEALLTVADSLGSILVTLLTNPSNTFSTAVEAFREIGTSVKELFVAVKDASEEVIVRLYNALAAIGVELEEMLEEIADAGKEVFFSLLVVLIGLVVDSIQVFLWAYNKANEYLSWAMEVINVAVDSLTDVIEAVVDGGGGAVTAMADWFVEGVDDVYEFVRDRVIQPLLAAGKLALIGALAASSALFLAAAFVVLATLADSSDADYLDLPDDLNTLQTDYADVVHTLDSPAEDHGIVVFSDFHMENQDDIDGGLGNFYKNADLVESVLGEYVSNGQDDYEWSVVFNGDIEEVWIDSDVTYYTPAEKVESVVETHEDIFGVLSDEFYTYQSPRRFVKVRGNHDNSFEDSQVVNAFAGQGFPNIDVYDYVVTERDGRDIVIMHGHQFDPWNCDANSDIGEFLTNFVKEPVSALNSTAADIFGDDLDMSGDTWEINGKTMPSPEMILPQYAPDQWDEKIDDVENPELVDSLPHNIMVDESDAVDTLRELDASLVMGHTHDPKLMKDGENDDQFLANTGTSGYWEGCIWCLEIAEDNVTLNGWTDDGNGGHDREFVVALEDDGTADNWVVDATF